MYINIFQNTIKYNLYFRLETGFNNKRRPVHCTVYNTDTTINRPGRPDAALKSPLSLINHLNPPKQLHT